MASEIAVLLSKIFKLDNGVEDGCEDAILSDTVDLKHPGFFEPRSLGGDIKYTDIHGNTGVMTFDVKEVSKFKVKRIWSTGTTAGLGIKIYYK